MTAPISVLVVDDHRMFAEALEMLLAGEQDALRPRREHPTGNCLTFNQGLVHDD